MGSATGATITFTPAADAATVAVRVSYKGTKSGTSPGFFWLANMGPGTAANQKVVTLTMQQLGITQRGTYQLALTSGERCRRRVATAARRQRRQACSKRSADGGRGACAAWPASQSKTRPAALPAALLCVQWLSMW